MDYLDKYLDDLYHLKTNFEKITKQENISRSKVDNDFKQKGLITPRAYYGAIDTGIEELDFTLKQKYNSMVTRCNGNNNNKYHEIYNGMKYIPIYEWVEFCNSQKDLLIDMWDDYTLHNKELKYAISIDRIDNNKGYEKDNLQFVTHGYNSWKRNIRPISVKHNEKTNYFMSCEEGSEHYGIRRQTIGDLLRGVKRKVSDDYEVKNSTIEDVLRENNISKPIEYYNKHTI